VPTPEPPDATETPPPTAAHATATPAAATVIRLPDTGAGSNGEAGGWLLAALVAAGAGAFAVAGAARVFALARPRAGTAADGAGPARTNGGPAAD
jgi:hypothetical protein